MAYQTLGTGTAVAKAPMKETTTKRFTSKVRLHVVPKSGQMVNIKTVTHNVLLGMRNNDPSISFMDTKGQAISLNTFTSYTSTTFNDAFGLVTRAGRSPEIIVGLEFESTLSWSRHRNAMISQLKQMNVFMKPHLCISWSSIDVVNIGHAHLQHPQFSDMDVLKTELTTSLKAASNKKVIKDKFASFYIGNEVQLPSFYFHPGNANQTLKSGKQIASNALELYVDRSHIEYMKALVEASDKPLVNIIFRHFMDNTLLVQETLGTQW